MLNYDLDFSPKLRKQILACHACALVALAGLLTLSVYIIVNHPWSY